MNAATVECYAGYLYPERPRAFRWEGELVRVAAVDRQWRTPAGTTFHVQAADKRRFVLSYDVVTSTWDVQPLDVQLPRS